MTKLERAKEIIAKYYDVAKHGIFDVPSLVNDERETIYCEDGLTILICYLWGYFEVYGLSDEEFEELSEYYFTLD